MNEAPKRFTPDEANRTLPLVRRIVDDILDTGRKMRTIGQIPRPDPADIAEYDALTGTLKSLLEEIESLGCQYKDWNFSLGLVDFPAVVDGREVLLCWRSDEAEILHFHGYEEGYAGRRTLPRPPPGAEPEPRKDTPTHV